MRSSLVRLWCAAIVLHSSLAAAQVAIADVQNDKPLKQLSLEELSQVQVTTVTRQPIPVIQTAAAVYIITHEDIHRSGLTTLPEILRLAPGVEVARIDSNKWSIGIRGFGSRLSRSVLVLIDGRTVYTTLLAGTYWEVQDTFLEDIDRIEVIRGPGGTIWGPNAVNGIINIITKRSSETHGLNVTAAGASFGSGSLEARYGGGNGQLDYRVYLKGFSRGPQFHWDRRDFDDWRSIQGGFRTDWEKSDKDKFTLQGDVYDQVAGESVVATSYTAPFSRVVDGNANLNGGNLLARWTHEINKTSDFQIQFYYDRANRREPNFVDLRDTYDVDYLQHMMWGERQRITWGGGMRFSRGDDHVVVSGLTFVPAARIDRLLTAFVQDEIALVPRKVSLTLGTKLLNTNFASFEPEPTARIIWTPTEATSFWAAATHAVRTPSDAERDFFLSGFLGTAPGGTPFFARFNANRNFRSEQMNGYELGYRQLLSKTLYLDIATFYNHYSSLFSEDITGTPFVETDPAPTHLLLPAQFGNGLLGQTKGFEIAPEWRPTSYWRLRGSYSYLKMNLEKSRNSLDIGTAPGIMGSSPNHQVFLQSFLSLPKRTTFDFDYRYVSKLIGQSVPAYSTMDARAAWRPILPLEIALIGRNLLQPHHPEFGTDPGGLVGIRRSLVFELKVVK